MAPTLVSAGSGSFFQGGAPTPGIPAGVLAGDLLVLWQGTQAANPTVPSGYTSIVLSANNTVANQRCRLSYKEAVGGDSAPTIADDGGNNSAQIFCFRGVKAGAAVDASNSNVNNTPSASYSATGVTTTVNNTLVCAFFSNLGGTPGVPNWSGYANGTLESLAELSDAGAAGCGVAVAGGRLPASGASGAITATCNQSNGGAVNLVVALVGIDALHERGVRGVERGVASGGYR